MARKRYWELGGNIVSSKGGLIKSKVDCVTKMPSGCEIITGFAMLFGLLSRPCEISDVKTTLNVRIIIHH